MWLSNREDQAGWRPYWILTSVWEEGVHPPSCRPPHSLPLPRQDLAQEALHAPHTNASSQDGNQALPLWPRVFLQRQSLEPETEEPGECL